MEMKSSNLYEGKRRIVFILLIIAILLTNIIASAFIFLDIRLIEVPETTIYVDLIEVNSEEAIIYYSIEIYNPNQFEIIVDNFEVSTNIIDGDEIARLKIEGGSIPSQGNQTFTSSDKIAFKEKGSSILTSKITGTVGVKLLGIIKKTLPIAVNVITSAKEVINDISSPIIHIWGDFGEITPEGINLTGTIEIYNPNSFDMYVEDLSLEIKTENDQVVGNLDVIGGTIRAKSSKNLYGNGRILIEALNAKTLNVNISSAAGIKIAGINKSVPFSVDVELKIPRLEDIFPSVTPTEAIIKADMKATLRGFVSNITLEIINPNKIGLIARDIVFSIYRVDRGQNKLIGKCTIEEGTVGPEDTTVLWAQIPLPYRKLLFSRGEGFLPDALLVMVKANVTIPGLDYMFWMGVSGYQDMHPFL
ncbi:MAG: LEA type 2 family protein [Thermoplasmatales archaeon]|nr:MAG: LEA type 2 family protein [Thermoplasmatales archaeon]